MKRLQENLVVLADSLSSAGRKRATALPAGAFRYRIVHAAIRFLRRALNQ